MIIGAAVALTVQKFVKRFGGKKKKKSGTSSNTSADVHNCTECSAECQLRNLPKMIIEKNSEACIQTKKESKLLQS